LASKALKKKYYRADNEEATKVEILFIQTKRDCPNINHQSNLIFERVLEAQSKVINYGIGDRTNPF
jgi:hypothetical protein